MIKIKTAALGKKLDLIRSLNAGNFLHNFNFVKVKLEKTYVIKE